MEALCASTACLKYVEKQAELLKQYRALILLKKAQAVKNLKELECLKAEAEGSKSSHFKRLCCKGSDADPSSSNIQTVSSNLIISVSSLNASDKANLSVDLSCLFFWNSSLANFFSL